MLVPGRVSSTHLRAIEFPLPNPREVSGPRGPPSKVVATFGGDVLAPVGPGFPETNILESTPVNLSQPCRTNVPTKATKPISHRVLPGF